MKINTSNNVVIEIRQGERFDTVNHSEDYGFALVDAGETRVWGPLDGEAISTLVDEFLEGCKAAAWDDRNQVAITRPRTRRIGENIYSIDKAFDGKRAVKLNVGGVVFDISPALVPGVVLPGQVLSLSEDKTWTGDAMPGRISAMVAEVELVGLTFIGKADRTTTAPRSGAWGNGGGCDNITYNGWNITLIESGNGEYASRQRGVEKEVAAKYAKKLAAAGEDVWTKTLAAYHGGYEAAEYFLNWHSCQNFELWPAGASRMNQTRVGERFICASIA